MAVKIDGKMVSARIKANLAERVASLKERGLTPVLAPFWLVPIPAPSNMLLENMPIALKSV